MFPEKFSSFLKKSSFLLNILWQFSYPSGNFTPSSNAALIMVIKETWGRSEYLFFKKMFIFPNNVAWHSIALVTEGRSPKPHKSSSYSSHASGRMSEKTINHVTWKDGVGVGDLIACICIMKLGQAMFERRKSKPALDKPFAFPAFLHV